MLQHPVQFLNQLKFRYRWLGYSLLCLVIFCTVTAIAQSPLNFNFIGEASLETGLMFQNTEVGGLSGITYHPDRQVYYLISDDRSKKAPARFYTLTINFSHGSLQPDGATLTQVTTLKDKQGQPFPPGSVDLEGIAYTDNRIWIASEGDTKELIPPFIKQFSLDGIEQESLPIPEKFIPTNSGESKGVRNNLSFESLTLTPDHQYLFTATENALFQDGEEATTEQGSPCRILRYNLATNQPDQEFIYITEPVVASPISSGLSPGFQVSGLVDLLALDEFHLLSLERSFSLNTGNTIQLFKVFLKEADPVQDQEQLQSNLLSLRPVKKTLLLNLNTLDIPLDNVEGLTFGPVLADGRQSLILISDNNFNTFQKNQILAFTLNQKL